MKNWQLILILAVLLMALNACAHYGGTIVASYDYNHRTEEDQEKKNVLILQALNINGTTYPIDQIDRQSFGCTAYYVNHKNMKIEVRRRDVRIYRLVKDKARSTRAEQVYEYELWHTYSNLVWR